MKSLISTLILGAGLIFSSCKSNTEYKEFKEFISEEGKFGKNKVNKYLEFSVNGKKFFCGYTTLNNSSEGIFVDVDYGEIKENFFDNGSNGLDDEDFYLKLKKDGKIIKNSISENEKLRYNNFVKDIPIIYKIIHKNKK